ncbi:MAG: NADH-quinone oxidoreductase subunit C [Actinomycetota bacterium]|nr:NADH-quinone oxidoreductase subunit C [Actinomycetota bacterium]
MGLFELKEKIEQRWPGQAKCLFDAKGAECEITCGREVLPWLCGWLFLGYDCSYAGLVVEEGASQWQLRHVFYNDGGFIHVLPGAPLAEKTFPSIVEFVHAADWHEREAEDMFGLVFEGHPRLGDFILHDDAWQENVEPMRRGFDSHAAMSRRKPDTGWRPHRIVREPGAFVMPIGPKFSGVTESVHFLLETVGEDVIRFTPRLFYKWRAIEKLAEGKKADDVLLLAERFAATTAFAHGLAFCQAVECICGTEVPERAKVLRVFLAELERLRQHAGAIQEICESTALVVAASQSGIFEEEMLRASGGLTGHRYLFGLLAPGGLLCDLADNACRVALERSKKALAELNELERRLRVSSSFLDRLEEVGSVASETAAAYGLLGPIARASGVVRDMRRARPYSGYEKFQFDIPGEQEGDGYARLRVLFAEARQSVRIMEQAVAFLQEGPVRQPVELRAGAALGWVEAPRGGAFHWVRLDEHGHIVRYHVAPPSFANWHGFHLAVEKFAFQDFPIMLSSFDLSVAENDR